VPTIRVNLVYNNADVSSSVLNKNTVYQSLIYLLNFENKTQLYLEEVMLRSLLTNILSKKIRLRWCYDRNAYKSLAATRLIFVCIMIPFHVMN